MDFKKRVVTNFVGKTFKEESFNFEGGFRKSFRLDVLGLFRLCHESNEFRKYLAFVDSWMLGINQGFVTSKRISNKGISYVRQGDPLAPFLFIIAAKGLNVALKEVDVFFGFSP